MTETQTPRRLHRSTTDRKLGGVCGGLGDYFGIDPVIFRLAFVLLVFAGGSGLLAYVIGWIVLPSADDPLPVRSRPEGERRWTGPAIIGVVLVVAGIVTLVDSSSWFGLDFDAPGIFWPLLFIGGGAWLLLREGSVLGGGDDTDDADDEPIPPATSSLAVEPWEAGALDEVAAPATPPGPTDTVAAEVTAAPAPRRGPSIAALTMGALLVFYGVVALGAIVDWWDVDLASVLAIGLVMTGVGLVASAMLGQGWGLLLVGLAIGALLVPASLVDVPLGSGVGERVYVPRTVAELEDDGYRLGVGELVVDLRAVADEVPPGEVVEVDAELGIGRLVVLVPDDVDLDVRLDANLGQSALDLPRRRDFRENDGFGADLDLLVDAAGPEAQVATFVIDAQVGIGQVEIAERR